MSSISLTPRVKLRVTSRRVPRVRSKSAAAVSGADPEPNMRLSRAIVVMLLLHVVAVGGIFAFSMIKDHDAKSAPASQQAVNPNALEAEESTLAAKPRKAQSHGKVDPSKIVLRPSVYVVRAGETLTQIANDHRVTLEALVAANGASTVSNGLHPGQEIRLPSRSPEPELPRTDSTSDALSLIEGHPASGASAAAASNSVAKPSHLPPDSGKIYVVGKGENPHVIAEKLKVNYEALVKLNQIDDRRKLKPGQKLHIPSPVKAR